MSQWIDIGALDDVPRLGSRVVRMADEKVAIFRTEDDQVFALVDKCPHRQGPLSQGIVHGCRVTCPLHNFVIDLASGEAVAPDEGRAKTIPARVANGRIEIQAPGLEASSTRQLQFA